MTDLIATYRLQLRNGVDFAVARDLIPTLAALGFSHLYLSPIFTAQSGSTHGYDITDPQAIDPVLGGADGYRDLAEAAQAHGIGLILDIVPNHTAFSIENIWLNDVLRHGHESRYADHFDIDWSQRLVLPWLEEPFDDLLEKKAVQLRDGHMVVGDLVIPMKPGTQQDDIAAAHDAQAWRLTRWEHERDGITHRRFFSVTGLIGMRVEDAHVFAAMHATILELVKNGHVQGLRVDHIDGLADPAAYLVRLKAAVADVPVWVEKILTGDEAMPEDWPVAGTTGYEAARQIARVLTVPEGHARLQEAWQSQTGDNRDFHAAVSEAKKEIVTGELATELHQLIALATELATEKGIEVGPETTREAVIALLVSFPRYRSYLTPATQSPEDLRLIKNVAEDATAHIGGPSALDMLVDATITADSPAARRLQTRFQQISGALLAKSHEDTAAFRQTAYLAACEVGADPDAATINPKQMQDWCNDRLSTALTLTSSHDTKRSEDARMRLVAMSHCPAQALDLLAGAAQLPQAAPVAARDRWYAVQSVLAIWDPEAEGVADRLVDHLQKALREAKTLTSWTRPDVEAEQDVFDFAKAVLADWRQHHPAALKHLIAKANHLSLAQVILRMLLPGVPDLYQSCLTADFSLTDPDNRRPVAFDELAEGPQGESLSRAKYALTRALLALRYAQSDTCKDGVTLWSHNKSGFVLTRRLKSTEIVARVDHTAMQYEITVNGALYDTRQTAPQNPVSSSSVRHKKPIESGVHS